MRHFKNAIPEDAVFYCNNEECKDKPKCKWYVYYKFCSAIPPSPLLERNCKTRCETFVNLYKDQKE